MVSVFNAIYTIATGDEFFSEASYGSDRSVQPFVTGVKKVRSENFILSSVIQQCRHVSTVQPSVSFFLCGLRSFTRAFFAT